MPCSLDYFYQQIVEQEIAQCAVNRAVNAVAAEHVYRLVKGQAEYAHAAYPQYVGYWNGWQPVRFVREIRTKGGVAFKVGDYSIVTARDVTFAAPDLRHLAYSTRNNSNTAVPGDAFVFIG